MPALTVSNNNSRLKRGSVCPDSGRILWAYYKGKPYWLEPDAFHRMRQKIYENVKAYNRQPAQRAKAREWGRRYYHSMPEARRKQLISKVLEYGKKHKNKLYARLRTRYATDPDYRAKVNWRNRLYNQSERGRLVRNAYRSTWEKKQGESYRILKNLRRRLLEIFRAQGVRKSCRCKDLIGCGPAELRSHLEKQFLPGMSWDNYGPNGWHIDHIKPCALFDFTQPEQRAACFHYTNLQPLWAEDNFRKSCSYAISNN